MSNLDTTLREKWRNTDLARDYAAPFEDAVADWWLEQFHQLLNEKREAIEELRRTDDTQMSHDHVYDEALDDVLSILND